MSSIHSLLCMKLRLIQHTPNFCCTCCVFVKYVLSHIFYMYNQSYYIQHLNLTVFHNQGTSITISTRLRL